MAAYLNKPLIGDCRVWLTDLAGVKGLEISACITSPPYFGLRSYLTEDDPAKCCEIGTETDLDEYISALVSVFWHVRGLLADDGTLWIVIGDSYNGSGGSGGDYGPGGKREGQPKYKGRNVEGLQKKDLIFVPWHLALALQKDGWLFRQIIIWHKPNGLPESVKDRCTQSHEYVFLFSKSQHYYFDLDAIRLPHKPESLSRMDRHWGGDSDRDSTDNSQTLNPKQFCHPEGRNPGSVWTVPTARGNGEHFATFPPALVAPMILASTRPGDIVLDPFFGSGTVGAVAEALGRNWIGIELNREYEALAKARTAQRGLFLCGDDQ